MTKEIRTRLPKRQSFKDRFVEKINAQEENLILGPVGASPTAVHPTGPTPPLGKPPRPMFDRLEDRPA